MDKLRLIANLVRIFLPSWLVRRLIRDPEHYRGAKIDAKAAAVGRLANLVRGEGPMPTVSQSRLQMAKMTAQVDRSGPELAQMDDISLEGADGAIMGRLYRSDADRSLRPALVYFHGGGFVQGDLETHHALCAKLAKWSGCVVIAVDYRLAPEHPYPAGVEDCLAAYEDIVERAAELGIDAANIGVGGDSAGGCFAAVVSQQMRDEGGPIPRFQVLIYPVTDGHVNSTSVNDLADAYILPKARMVWYRDMYAGEFRNFEDPKFSPLLVESFVGLPESYIVTGGFDPLLDDGADYAEALQLANVPTVYRHFPGQVHAFVNLTKFVPEGTIALREIAAWMRAIGRR